MLKVVYFKSLEDREHFFNLISQLPNWSHEPVTNIRGAWAISHPVKQEGIFHYMKNLHCFEEENTHEH